MNAPARVLNLLHAARPEDVAPVLSLLSGTDLAAALASEHCDPKLRTVAADREALRHALLRLRDATEHLPTAPNAVRETVRLAARAPYQRVLPDGVTPYGRPQADLSRRLSGDLDAVLADDPRRWFGVMALVDKWSRSFADLLDEAAGWRTESQLPTVFARFRQRTELFLPGVLLAMAPAPVVADVLAYTGRRSDGLIEGLLKHAPYQPAYLDYAFGPDGTDYARQSLCAGTGKPLAVAHVLLDRGVGVSNTALITAAHADLALRLRVFRSSDSSDSPWQTSNLSLTTPEQFHALLSAAETPEGLLGLLMELRPLLRRNPASADLRLHAYRRLALMAGPEPVWSAELAYAGGLDAMHPSVRASMAENDTPPLFAAADAVTPPAPPPAPPNQGSLTDWTLEEAVRTRLDGRLDRWRTILRSSDEASEAPSAAANQSALAIVQWATDQSVRPAGRDIENLNKPADTDTDSSPGISARTRISIRAGTDPSTSTSTDNAPAAAPDPAQEDAA